jgi:hypothetical protein
MTGVEACDPSSFFDIVGYILIAWFVGSALFAIIMSAILWRRNDD